MQFLSRLPAWSILLPVLIWAPLALPAATHPPSGQWLIQVFLFACLVAGVVSAVFLGVSSPAENCSALEKKYTGSPID